MVFLNLLPDFQAKDQISLLWLLFTQNLITTLCKPTQVVLFISLSLKVDCGFIDLNEMWKKFCWQIWFFNYIKDYVPNLLSICFSIDYSSTTQNSSRGALCRRHRQWLHQTAVAFRWPSCTNHGLRPSHVQNWGPGTSGWKLGHGRPWCAPHRLQGDRFESEEWLLLQDPCWEWLRSQWSNKAGDGGQKSWYVMFRICLYCKVL